MDVVDIINATPTHMYNMKQHDFQIYDFQQYIMNL